MGEMRGVLYPPDDMDYNEWLCDLMCGGPEDEEEEDDRTETHTGYFDGSDRARDSSKVHSFSGANRKW